MSMQSNANFAPEGTTGSRDADRHAAAPQTAPRDDDRYDDGLVHSHAWAASATGRKA